jgi:membrane fusion protein (multidrug efflux system)
MSSSFVLSAADIEPSVVFVAALIPIAGVLPPLLVIGAGLYLWWQGQGQVTTDNAYVRMDKVALSVDVSGRVAEVLVRENMAVKAGQVLVRLGERPFRIALNQAEAELAGARLQVQQLKSGTGGSEDHSTVEGFSTL